jgi:hypothetical protein
MRSPRLHNFGDRRDTASVVGLALMKGRRGRGYVPKPLAHAEFMDLVKRTSVIYATHGH